MLIKLTDRCTMNCQHCMDDAKETGNDMSLDTFQNAIKFGRYLGVAHFALSGGEPTENAQILDMCKIIDSMPMMFFSIVSNGMWLKSAYKRSVIRQICAMDSFLGMQVYSHRKWYKEYDYVVSHREDYEKYRNIIVDTKSPIHMLDKGRARSNPEARKESEKNTHFMSCLNAALFAKQIDTPMMYAFTLNAHRLLCKPQVDALGGVHLSESRLCPTVGNVNSDGFDEIWHNMKTFRPCGGCMQYRTFMQSTRPDVVRARNMLGTAQVK